MGVLPDVRARQRDLAPALEGVREAIPDLDHRMAEGCLLTLSEWLRDNLYVLGRKLTPKETIERLTGSPMIDPRPTSRTLDEKLGALAA